jgi:hypothetical protein
MVQGHTFTALLRPDEMAKPWETLHGLLHGLTGPAFLLGAGLAFGITTYPRYAQHHVAGPALWARLRRYALLLAIGYALQLPGGSVASALSASGSRLQLVVRVGPLQLIALTMGLCQLLALIAPSARRHAQWVLGLALVVACATRAVYVSHAAEQVAPFWGAFLDDRGGSQYPIFPNAAFALLGAGISPLFLHAERRPRGRTLVVLGTLLAAGLYFAFQHGVIPYERGLFWRTSPFMTLFRFGLVMVLLGLCERAPARSTPGSQSSDALPRPRRDSIVESLAQHSLIAYVAHLFLLYGSPLTPSLVKRFGLSLSLLECTVAWLLVMGLTVAITHAFQWLSRERVGTMRWLQAGLTLLSLVMLAR